MTAIVWQESGHPLDNFGEVYNPPINSAEFDARAVLVWRRVELLDLIQRLVEAATAVQDLVSDTTVLNGLSAAIVVASIVPIHIKILKNDEIAMNFVRLIKEDSEGYQYFDADCLGSDPSIDALINFYIDKNILERRGQFIYIRGNILKRATLLR